MYIPALPPPHLRMPNIVLRPDIASGRGLTSDDAQVACLAEAAERYSAQFRGDEKRVRARARDLPHAAILPSEALQISGGQWGNRKEWNERHERDEWIPEPFDIDEEIEWFEGWSLTREHPVYLPMSLYFRNYGPPGTRWIGDAGSDGCAAGCAAGSGREDAIGSALLELIERDAVSIWWYNKIKLPRLNPQSFADPVCDRIVESLEGTGRHVWCHDIRTDFGVPVVIAIASAQDGSWHWGASAHFDVEVAFRKSWMELYQLADAPTRPGPPPEWQNSEEEEDPRCAEGNVYANSGEYIRALADQQIDVHAFDLTREDVGVTVYRVVAPGMRHTNPRFAPGRLYDVPVRLGWLLHPRNEPDLRQYAP